MESITKEQARNIKSVSLLGSKTEIEGNATSQGLVVYEGAEKTNSYGYAFKVTF